MLVLLKTIRPLLDGLSAGTTESKRVEFIEGRATTAGQDKPKIYNAKIFKTEDRDDDKPVGTRITVGERSVRLLTSYSFWPGTIYARPWNFHYTRPNDNEASLPIETNVPDEASLLGEADATT